MAASGAVSREVKAPAAASAPAGPGAPASATSGAPASAASGAPAPTGGSVEIVHGEALDVARTLPDGSFTLVYLDPPFNTGRTQERHAVSTRRADRPAS
ncbi:MAG: site-specific DNA-methyltransferase, partial [Actinobacteria bacterium]|nr:site-specific DNA-methyltransferase [Actinomycetota bacterium]